MKHSSRFLVTAALAIAAPFVLVGCSTGSANDTTSPSADAQQSSGLGAKWGACVRDAGFDVTDPTDDLVESGGVIAPQGVDQEAFANAAATCSKSLGVSTTSSADKQKYERQYEAVTACVRENGFEDAPEQKPGVLDFTKYERASDPKFAEVAAKCLEEFAPDSKVQSR